MTKDVLRQKELRLLDIVPVFGKGIGILLPKKEIRRVEENVIQ